MIMMATSKGIDSILELLFLKITYIIIGELLTQKGTKATTIDIESLQLFICVLSASNHPSDQMESILLSIGFP